MWRMVNLVRSVRDAILRSIANLIGAKLIVDIKAKPEELGLIPPDSVLAIRPEFARDAEKAIEDGQRNMGKALVKRTQASLLNTEARTLEGNGMRKIKAVEKFRTATGSK